MLLLGIESSCDETAAAVLTDGKKLLANVVHSQIEVHGRYGGVVPEIASRKHLEHIYPVVETALTQAAVTLDQLDGIAVTRGPGLIGSLLVGLSFAKALSLVKGIPYVGVDHINGHLLSIFLEEERPGFPYVALVASGGHSSIFLVDAPDTFRLLGRTRDDAAGEAFDKVGKLLGLDYPGGPVISRLAATGDPSALNFPRAWLEPKSLDFSFSGIKTAVANYVNTCRNRNETLNIPDICASFQEAVTEVLVAKTVRAALERTVKNVVLAGGVGANPRLRHCLRTKCDKAGLRLFMPSPDFCTDNAAMIAMAGYYRFPKEATLSQDMDVFSRTQYPLS